MKGTHVGWTAEEDRALLHAIEHARATYAPLRTAFESVAKMTDRQPNSVRNHYYTQLKAQTDPEPSFVPFTEAESLDLLREVLLAQSRGISVRACTLQMANGDTRKMLRLQNKYRSLLKTRRATVLALRETLLSEGHSVPDPYLRDPNTPRIGRPPREPLGTEATIRALLSSLYDNLIAIARGESAS